MLRQPTKDILQSYLISLPIVLGLFALVYGGTNYWGSSRPNPYQLWHSMELLIPLIPEFIFIYFSLFLLAALPLLCMSAAEIRRMSKAIIVCIFFASIVFIFFPAPVGYTRNLEVLRYQGVFAFLYNVDNVANTFPSLHVAISLLLVRGIQSCHPQAKFLWIWFFLICLSVLFTHQHHLIDIAGGLILGEFSFRKFYCNSPQLVYEHAS